jgi:hypothetical protein
MIIMDDMDLIKVCFVSFVTFQLFSLGLEKFYELSNMTCA